MNAVYPRHYKFSVMHCMLGKLFFLAAFQCSIHGAVNLGDISQRYMNFQRNTRSELDPINIDEVIAPKEIIDLVKEAQLSWDELPTATKIISLWQFGFVFIGTNVATPAYSQLVQVYTECDGSINGIDMDSIALTSSDMNTAKCKISQCSGASESYVGNGDCSPALYDTMRCAIRSVVWNQDQHSNSSFVPLALQIPDHENAVIWSDSVTKTDSMPYPQLYAQLSSTDGKTGLYSIHMKPLTKSNMEMPTQCESDQMDIVIPCAQSLKSVSKRKFCPPKVDKAKLMDWIKAAVSNEDTEAQKSAMMRNFNTSKGSRMSISTIILLILLILLICLAAASFYFLWYRPQRNAKQGREKDFLQYNEEKDGQLRPKAALKSYLSTPNAIPMLDGGRGTLSNDDVFDIGGNNESLQDSDASQSSYVFIASAPDTSIMIDSNDPNGYCNYKHKEIASKFSSSRSQYQSSTQLTQTSSACSDMESIQEYVQGSEELQQFISDPKILSYHIEYNEINFLRTLSKGAFGEVWLGQLEDRHVAIKSLLPERKHVRENLEEFAAEIRLMCNLDHPNILSLIGVSWNCSFNNLCAVTEYMENGDLDTVNQNLKGNLSWEKKIRVAIDTAEGLLYLHSQQPIIVHRDIKSKNILLDGSWHAKLADFGISRRTATNETMTSGVGTLLWTAPEIIEGKKYSEKADIYSLGVVLGELDTGERPFSHMKNENGDPMPAMQMVQQVRLGKLKVKMRDECPQCLVELVERCTALDPNVRPTSMELVFTLRSKIAPTLS